MIQMFTCDCLNVTVHGDPQDLSQEEVSYARHLIDSIADQSRGEISHFLSNSRLVKLDHVKTRHSFLCMKRNIDSWQICYCTVCDKETHAIPLNDANRDAAHFSLALVSSLLLSEEDKIDLLKSDSKYSPTFGIILPSATYKNVVAEAINMSHHNMALSLGDVDMEATETVKQFVYEQRRQMEDRIKSFALEQNQKFEELCRNAQEEKNDFLQMVESIKRRHDMITDSDSFDKENNSELSKLEKINFNQERSGNFFQSEESMFQLSGDYIRKQTAQQQEVSYSKQKIRSADFDGLFDIDDIDVDAACRFKDEHDRFDEEEEAEEHDVFPLKESNLYSKEANAVTVDDLDEILPLSRSGINIMSSENSMMRSRKMASSVVQNIPHPYQNKSRHSQQTPNSLPIKIPHFRSRMSDLDSDESNLIKPGESIADRIQKLARSVRNETDILDDRPRRRLNTGDLIKSRPILN